MKILNLGCGTKFSHHPDVINIDWSMYLRLKRSRLGRFIAPIILDQERLHKFRSIPDNIIVHNLAKGIPFPDGSVDVVYHSHLLEHLDRDVAESFLREVKRVLRLGGIQRIVVPDLEQLCRDYLEHMLVCEQSERERSRHDDYIAAMIEQSVRKEAFSARHKKPLRRYLENLILGDARKRGETHQWMYDRINLSELLERLGYRNITIQDYNTSQIPNWHQYNLDIDEHGHQYKPKSLYIEATK